MPYKKYYVVAKGRKPGIYATWDECDAQVKRFNGAIYKKFENKDKVKAKVEAEEYFEKNREKEIPMEVFTIYDFIAGQKNS